jgi:alanine racemase
MGTSSWNQVEIDLAALRHNFRQLRQLVGSGVGILAMVKADAYGHGLLPASRAFAQAGARDFAVAEVEEGVRLRQAGVTGRIVVMLGVDRQGAAEAVAHELTPVVYDLEAVAALSAAAARAGRCQDVQLKVDVGMGRLGILPRDCARFLAGLARFPHLRLAGILSHFPLADDDDPRATAAQAEVFREVLARLPGDLGGGRPYHIANSAALLRFPGMHFDMVRPGIALYGSAPAPALLRPPAPPLFPAMRFRSRVIQVKELPAGRGVSYGHRYVTARPTRLAVLPVGYDDGYLRRLTGRAQVLVAGRRAPVCGTICMNACMVDVTDIAGVRPGDEVVLLGRQGNEEVRAEEMAAWSDSICYEVFCLLGACNARIYHGEEPAAAGAAQD